MKAQEGTLNQEKALVGAFSVIVKTDCETDGSSAALLLLTVVYSIVILIYIETAVSYSPSLLV